MVSQTQLAKLQSIQNKCFKLVFKQEPCPMNYHAQHVLRINEIIKLLNMKHGHRVQHSHLPAKILETSKTDSINKSLVTSHPYHTHHKNSLNLPSACGTWYKNSFLCHSITDYSTIPPSVKNLPNEALFVSSCKSFLFTGKWKNANKQRQTRHKTTYCADRK